MKRNNKNATRRRNVSKNGLHSADFGLKWKLNKTGLLHRSGRLILRKLGRLDEAISILRKALELNPDNVLALNNLGIALKEQNRFVEVIGYYRKSLEILPKRDIYNNLALALKADEDHGSRWTKRL